MSGALSCAHRRKVSILYFEGCPNHRPTVDRARALNKEFGLNADVEEVELTSPEEVERLRFLGSPTVQVDGLDIEPEARNRTDYAMSCRLYNTPDGLPSRDMLLAALGASGHEPAHHPGERAEACRSACCCEASGASRPHATMRHPSRVSGGLIATGGSVVTAILSSACCWLPLLLVAFGASAAGVSKLFGPWRPLFIVAAVTMLCISFYLTFVRKPITQCCAKDGSSRGRLGRAAWWASAVVVAAFVLFPKYIGVALGGSSSRAASPASASQLPSHEFVFHVEGMHCDACATTLTTTLSKIEGVTRANVDYASKTGRVVVSDETIIQRVFDATRRAGFAASMDAGSKSP